MIMCEICGKKFRTITWSHLRTEHGIKMEEYKRMFPFVSLISEETRSIISENVTRDWKNPKYRSIQLKHRKKQLRGIQKNRTGKTYEQIYGNQKAAEVRKKLSISHIGQKWRKGRKNPDFSGENHPMYGKKRTKEWRENQSIAMKELIKEGKLDVNEMMKRAKGDNFAENKFALLHPNLKRQAWVPLGFELTKGKKGGVKGYFVDFLDEKTKTIFELDGKEHLGGLQKQRDNKKDRLLHQLGYKIIRISTNQVLNNVR